VGAAPFVRADARSTMLAHLQAPPPVISVVRPGTPRAVDRLVVRALLKDPATRFQSAAEMQVAVRAARQHLTGSRPPEHAESGTGPSTPTSADEATTPAIATASATSAATAATSATTATAILPGLPSDATRTATLASFDRHPHPHPHSHPRPTLRAHTTTPHRPGTPHTTTPARPTPPIGTRSGSLQPVTSQKATDPPPPTSTAASRPAFVVGLVALLLVAVVVVAWSLAAVGGAPAPLAAGAQPETTAEASGPPSTLPSASAPAAPTAEPVAAATIPVPALADGTLADARAALASVGLTLGSVTAERAPRPLDTVLRVAPAIGTPVAPGTAVDVVVASGSNLVPRALGTHQVEALSSIRAAGFDVTTSTREDDAPPGTVLATVPAEGTEAQVGTTVTVVLAVPRTAGQPTATPTPAPTQVPPVPTPTSTTPPNGG
jgi:serine/threonine-protein kinase